jgi:hypothetical protein
MQYPNYFGQTINDIGGLLYPSYGNYQFNGNDSFYVGPDNGLLIGDGSTTSSSSDSVGSPTGSAIGDIGYAISNMSMVSPVASVIASSIMDALSPTSVTSVNAVNGMDMQSDVATAMGLSTAAGVDGVAGSSSNGMGSDTSGDGVSSASDSSSSSSDGGSSSGDSGSSSSDGGSSSGDGGSSGSGGDGGGDYMGGLIGMPEYIKGIATRKNTFGNNPAGPDDSYRKTQLGEYVIKKSAVKKYGKGLLDMINNEEISKKKLRGIL